MFGTNFPISEYYRQNIIDAETISRGGSWWTAVLLIIDPRTEKPFVAFYRWQKTQNGWKVRKQFSFKNSVQLGKALEVAERFSKKLDVK
jgi:hypothetical protein